MEMMLRKIVAIHQHYRKDRLAGSMHTSLIAELNLEMFGNVLF